jgi:prepilin-type N-terminal cleavage/methylation domain-containing protein
MKFPSPVEVEPKARWRPNGKRAFTLIEMVITTGIFSLVVLAMVYTQIFGLRQDELAQSKLGASDASRKGFDQLALDVRSAKTWTVGNMVAATYTGVAANSAQTGTALQLCLGTNLNTFVWYYFVTNLGTLYRMHTNQSPVLMCKNLTNSLFFQAEDYRGVVMSTRNYKSIIHVMLQFAQYQYPQTSVGAGFYYDFYKMEFRLTPHNPD